jgi:hypothetical protein
MKRISIILIMFIVSVPLIVFIILDKLHNLQEKEESDVISRVYSDRDDLMRFYNASPERCGAGVSLSPRDGTAGSAALEFACLIGGFRKIVWTAPDKTLLDSVKTEFANLTKEFERAAQIEGIRLFKGVSFRPEGEQDALLFILYALQSPFGTSINSYADGLLLGYSLADIEFYYQREGFWAYLKHIYGDGDLIYPMTYSKFSDEQKKLFDTFVKKHWIGSAEHQRFERDKAEADKWLQEYRTHTIEQLYQEIAELEQQREQQ